MGQNASKIANTQDERQRGSGFDQQVDQQGDQVGITQIKIHTTSTAEPGNAGSDLVESKQATGKTPEHNTTPTYPSQATKIPYKKTKSGREALRQRRCDFAIKHQVFRDNSMSWVESMTDGQDIPKSLLMIYDRSNREMLRKKNLLDFDVLDRADTIKLARLKAQVYLEQMTGLDDKLFEFYFHGKCHNLMDPHFFHCFNVTLSELGRLDAILTNRINAMVESFIYGNSPGYYYFEDEDQIADLIEEMPLKDHRRMLYLGDIFKLNGRYIKYKWDEPVMMMPENRILRERPSHYLKQRYWDVALWYNTDKSLDQIKKDLKAMQSFVSEGCHLSDFYNFTYRTYSRLFR